MLPHIYLAAYLKIGTEIRFFDRLMASPILSIAVF